jgi:cell division septation protein DedD
MDKRFLLIALALISAGPSSVANDPSASAARDNTPGQEAVEQWRRQAGQGDPSAQYDLAVCYLEGRGVPQSRETALEWLRRSASGGSVKAMELAGTLLMATDPFIPNYDEARQLLRKAAETGSVIAEINLAKIYRDGLGVPIDLLLAHRYAREAAGAPGAEPGPLLAEIEARMTPQQLALTRATPLFAIVSRGAPGTPAPPNLEASKPPAAPRSDHAWLVHLASVSSSGDAAREWLRLQKRAAKLAASQPRFVDVRLASGELVTRIFVGGFSERADAQHFCDDIKTIDCLPVRNPDYH